MLSISFRRNSLLFGESCFLVAYSFFTPYFFWPDIYNTRTKHVLLLTKTRRKLLSLLILLWDYLIMRLVVMTVILGTQIPYALSLVTIGSLVQRDALGVLIGLDEDELAYKALYYAPIVYRIGTFLMILMALKNRINYREWPTLDHFDIFSVNRNTQLRTMLICGLMIVPDIICTWVELMFTISYLRSEPHKWFQFTRNNKVTNVSFLALLSCINTTSCIIRYKPFVSILYTAICVRKHMRLIKSQLFLSFERTNSSTASLLMSRLSDQAKARPVDKKEAPFKMALSGEDLAEKLHQTPEASWQRQQQLEVFRIPQKPQIGLYIDSKVGALRRQAALVKVSQRDLIDGGGDDPLGWNEEPLYEIHSLFEFEKHLTQIYLFVASMDRCSPGGLFALTFFNLIAFFYAYLYNRELPSGFHSQFQYYMLASLFLGSRILPVCTLFIAGHLVELECRKIANSIEIIYLENSSHSLLYGQLKDSQHSLARIFRLLSWIKFDGDGLMAINLDSLKRLLFYVLSAIFIVIQYDSLLIIDNSPSTSIGSTEAPLGADRTNLSQLPKI